MHDYKIQLQTTVICEKFNASDGYGMLREQKFSVTRHRILLKYGGFSEATEPLQARMDRAWPERTEESIQLGHNFPNPALLIIWAE